MSYFFLFVGIICHFHNPCWEICSLPLTHCLTRALDEPVRSVCNHSALPLGPFPDLVVGSWSSFTNSINHKTLIADRVRKKEESMQTYSKGQGVKTIQIEKKVFVFLFFHMKMWVREGVAKYEWMKQWSTGLKICNNITILQPHENYFSFFIMSSIPLRLSLTSLSASNRVPTIGYIFIFLTLRRLHWQRWLHSPWSIPLILI